ncbi:MAG: hypothetical protein WC503_06320 [Candidatus Shapirobacteria bacterium]
MKNKKYKQLDSPLKKGNDKILNKIKTGEIRMKPRWTFVAKMWEQRLIWILFILATGLSVSGISFFAQKYNPKDLFEYGSVGWQVFYEDFPYYWLAGAIIFWILAIKMWQNLGNNYKITSQKIFVISGLILVSIVGLVLLLN